MGGLQSCFRLRSRCRAVEMRALNPHYIVPPNGRCNGWLGSAGRRDVTQADLVAPPEGNSQVEGEACKT
jgi:succinylarginine dihydrolase